MKSFGARWNNALAVAVLTCVLSVSFAPAVLRAVQLAPSDIDANAFPIGNSSEAIMTGIGPQVTDAAVSAAAKSAMGTAMCAGWTPIQGPRFCWDITFGLPTPGTCIAPSLCLGLGSIGIVAAVTQTAKSIFGVKPDAPTPGAFPYNGTLPGGSLAGCTGTPFISTTPSANPCAVYIPVASAGNTNPASSVSNALLNSGTSGAGTVSANSVSSALLVNSSAGTGLPPSPGITSSNVNNPSSPSVSSLLLNSYVSNAGKAATAIANVNIGTASPSGVQFGTWGDIEANAYGVTIIVGGHGVDGRTGVGGFYGYDTVLGVQPQALARQMCRNRPWKDLAITFIIQPSYFDGLCTARGYNATTTAATLSLVSATGTVNSNFKLVAASGTPATSVVATSTINPASGFVRVFQAPRVDIYAIPTRVRISARSTLYWSAQGVTSCAVSTPDGSFNENSLRGAASTVALYTNTIFTIACNAEDGSIVTKSVTVQTSN